MNINAILWSFIGHQPTCKISHPRKRFQPRLELLEDRLAPTVITVNSALDKDDGLPFNNVTTLREAIRLANLDAVADTIKFDAALTNKTIILGGKQLPTITNPVTITGLGADKLTIDGNARSRIFEISDSDFFVKIPVLISDLRLTRGSADRGGAIINRESLTLATSTLDHNSASKSGGGIYNDIAGELVLTNSTLSANSATIGSGGAIYIYDRATLELGNSTLTGNTARHGGAISNDSGTLIVTNSTFSANSAQLIHGLGGSGGRHIYL